MTVYVLRLGLFTREATLFAPISSRHAVVCTKHILFVLRVSYSDNKAITDGRPRPPRHQVGWDMGMCMSNFMMIGWEMAEILHIEISWKHVSVTYDLDLWPKILKIFVSHRVPILNVYVKFHDDRLRNDWDITLWNFAKTRTNTQTNRQTWALQYLALPLWGAR